MLKVMLHKGAHALAVARGVQDSSAESNRYHNKRFVALVTEIGQVCRLTDETSAAYADVISAIDSARLPFLPAGHGAPQLDIIAP